MAREQVEEVGIEYHKGKANEIWPNWSEGRPTKLRVFAGEHLKNGLYTDKHATVEYNWGPKCTLTGLRKNAFLPTTDQRHRSGVYRVFSSGINIDRCCGKDSTGTLYIGRAGAGRRDWSILRTRIQSLVKYEHHVTKIWRSSNLLQEKFPWDSLAIEWAYTGRILNQNGELVPEAKLAEGLLLDCYRDSFGELPPWNHRR